MKSNFLRLDVPRKGGPLREWSSHLAKILKNIVIETMLALRLPHGSHLRNVEIRCPSRIPSLKTTQVTIRPVMGRLGNQLLNVATGITVGTYIGAKQIELDESCLPFFQAIDVKIPSPSVILDVASASRLDHDEYPQATKIAANWFRTRIGRERPQDLSAGFDFLRQVIDVPDSWRRPAQEELLIHFRAGDIFSSRPHRNYAPPPLSFFETIASQTKTHQVVVLCEPGEYRYLDELVSALSKIADVRCEQPDLAGAVRRIRNCAHLVTSTGTFANGVAGLAEGLETVHYFGRPTFIPNSKAAASVTWDKAGEYLEKNMSNNWQNSHAQYSLWKSYPAEYLETSAGVAKPAAAARRTAGPTSRPHWGRELTFGSKKSG